MNEQKIRYIMMGLIVFGLILIAIGVYLIVLTDTVIANGANGILTIAGFIAGGLFVSVPAKIYLTLQLMKYNDEKLREKNLLRNNSTNEN